MEGYQRPCDEVGFNADEAHNIVKECVDGVLGGNDYNENNINQWTASIVEQSITHLVKLGKAYKYIVTCAVVQRSPYGFHTASSCFWDTTSDGLSPRGLLPQHHLQGPTDKAAFLQKSHLTEGSQDKC
ncbi:dynein light chain Tctex-type 3, isoform CRA_b [Mus musculus]|nr:dynein light chain Tctex-type 3, isoform CRA_b [Mus musculus]